MKVLVTCATGNIGRTVMSTTNQNNNIEWIPASRSGRQHLTLDFDKSDRFALLADEVGALDGLVLIAPRVEPLQELFPEPEAWHEYFDRSLVKPLMFLNALLNVQQFPKPFKIVAIGGLSSVCALPHYGSANALRLAWLGHVKSLALALGSQGVRINTLSLGAVLTDKYEQKLKLKAEQQRRNYQQQLVVETENIPTGRYSTLEDVAHAVHALLGPMSDQMTGQNLLMDGGFFRGY